MEHGGSIQGLWISSKTLYPAAWTETHGLGGRYVRPMTESTRLKLRVTCRVGKVKFHPPSRWVPRVGNHFLFSTGATCFPLSHAQDSSISQNDGPNWYWYLLYDWNAGLLENDIQWTEFGCLHTCFLMFELFHGLFVFYCLSMSMSSIRGLQGILSVFSLTFLVCVLLASLGRKLRVRLEDLWVLKSSIGSLGGAWALSRVSFSKAKHLPKCW